MLQADVAKVSNGWQADLNLTLRNWLDQKVRMRMTRWLSATAAMAATMFLTVVSAVACPVYRQPTLTDAREADAVVVGYVTKVRTLDNGAQLIVDVDHTIAGKVPPTVIVYWGQMMNNGPPDSISGGYVFALHKLPPIGSADSKGTYAIMQGICSGALVYPRGSPNANAIREMFGLRPEPLERPEQDTGKVGLPPIALIVCGLLVIAAVLIATVAVWRRRRQ